MHQPGSPVLFLAIAITGHLCLGIGATGPNQECLDTQKEAEKNWPEINYHASIFYYHWYRNVTHDNKAKSQWSHARGSLLLDKEKVYYNVSEDDITATYFPLLGAYSSKDVKTVDQHFRWIRSTGIGVVTLSWQPPMFTPGKTWPDYNVTMLFDVANKYGLKIAFIVEKYNTSKSKKAHYNVAYGGDTVETFCKYVMDNYGEHPALYKMYHNNPKGVPLYFMFLSNSLPPKNWVSGLKPGGSKSVRGTEYDGFFVMNLYKEVKQVNHALRGGFDGVFTYVGDASEDFNREAKKDNLVYFPSVYTGYNDKRIRYPGWETKREDGEHYKRGLEKIIKWKLPYMPITSFNEWHESTQIEPAAQNKEIGNTAYDPITEKTNVAYKYGNYPNQCPYYYLELTRKYVAEHLNMLKEEGLVTGDPGSSKKSSNFAD